MLPVFESLVLLETLALLCRIVSFGVLGSTLTVARQPRTHRWRWSRGCKSAADVASPGTPGVQVLPGPGVTDTIEIPAGRVSFSTTFAAGEGPALATVKL